MKDMTEHQRLVDEGSTSERELILAARAAGMSPEERTRIWTSVAAGCMVGGAVATGAAVGAKAGLLATLAPTLASWKSVAMVLLVISGTVATYALTRPAPLHDQPAVAPGEIRSVIAPPSAPIRTPGPGAEPGAAAPATPSPSLPRSVGAPRPSKPPPAGSVDSPPRPAEGARAVDLSRLAEESRMVIEARRALQAGDFTTTLRLLDAAAAAFPSGTLSQEREALAIQALARSGQHEAAAMRASAFLAKHPESPHAADLKAFTR